MKSKGLLLTSILILFTRLLSADDGVFSMTLEEAKARAESVSNDLRALNLQMLAQEYAFGLGARVFFPTLSVGFTRSDSVASLSPGDSSKNTLSVSLHQPLFDGGRTIFRRRAQKLDLTLQRYGFLQKREALLDQIWDLYHQLLLTAEKRRLQDEFHTVALRQLTVSRKELELGVVTEIDYVDTELEVKNLEAEMRKTKLDEENLLYQLKTLCGLPLSREVTLNGAVDFSYGGMALPSNPDFWLAVALDRNMEYRRMWFESAKSKEEYKLAETAWVPTVGADLTFSLSGDGFPLYEPGFAFKLTFQFPFNEAPVKTSLNASSTSVGQRAFTADVGTDVLPSLNYLADRRLALLKIQVTDGQLQSAEENLRFNIEQFLKNYTDEKTNLALKKDTLALLDRKRRVTREQLGVGEIKRIDYLKAQNEYYGREIAIRENILHLIRMERGFEQLLGLEAGELSDFIENAATNDGVPKGEKP
ncbi:MAG: TolC family protein [Spirochaetales bacterium]|nr:TolC family protein [Spirochaetales bacterium]